MTTPYGAGASTVSYTSNAVHEYTVVGGVNRAYDANGNLTDDGTNDYEYDYRNQLVRVTRQSDSAVIGLYEYDPLGRRTKKTIEDDSSVRYYHDRFHEIEEYSGSGALLRKYVYRDEIDSIAMLEAPDQADVDDDSDTEELVRLFYHCDGRTNIARLTAEAQTVVESYENDPYGNITIKDQTGSPTGTSPVGNPFVFQRRRHDEESGLIYFRARQYDPSRGHWMQRDPLGFGPGPNEYEFCSNNPITRTDPWGLEDEEVIELEDPTPPIDEAEDGSDTPDGGTPNLKTGWKAYAFARLNLPGRPWEGCGPPPPGYDPWAYWLGDPPPPEPSGGSWRPLGPCSGPHRPEPSGFEVLNRLGSGFRKAEQEKRKRDAEKPRGGGGFSIPPPEVEETPWERWCRLQRERLSEEYFGRAPRGGGPRGGGSGGGGRTPRGPRVK